VLPVTNGKDRVQEIVALLFITNGVLIDFLDDVEGLTPPKEDVSEVIAFLGPSLIKELREFQLAQSNLAETIENHCGIDVYDATQTKLRKRVHIGSKDGEKWVPLCGTLVLPMYLTAWPGEPLSPNGPSGCPECLAKWEPSK
jgi:hypothetical protein